MRRRRGGCCTCGSSPLDMLVGLVSQAIVSVVKWLLFFTEVRKFLATSILFGIAEVVLSSGLEKAWLLNAMLVIDGLVAACSWNDARKVQGLLLTLKMYAAAILIIVSSMAIFSNKYDLGYGYEDSTNVGFQIYRAIRLGSYNALVSSFSRMYRDLSLMSVAIWLNPEAKKNEAKADNVITTTAYLYKELERITTRSQEISDLVIMERNFLRLLNDRNKNDKYLKEEIKCLVDVLPLPTNEVVEFRQMSNKNGRKKILELVIAFNNYTVTENIRIQTELQQLQVKYQFEWRVLVMLAYIQSILCWVKLKLRSLPI